MLKFLSFLSLHVDAGRGRKRTGQSFTVKRLLQPRSGRISADPSGTNLITRRPFSYKVDTSVSYVATTLKSNYAAVFPDLTVSKIKGVRIDRISAWGAIFNGATEPVYLAVGDYYSAKDVGGANSRSRLNCQPKLMTGQCDEDTLISFEGCAHLHIVGVVYLEREVFPGKPAFDSAVGAPGKLPLNGTTLLPPGSMNVRTTSDVRPTQPVRTGVASADPVTSDGSATTATCCQHSMSVGSAASAAPVPL